MHSFLIILFLAPNLGVSPDKPFQFEPSLENASEPVDGSVFPYRAKIVSPLPKLNSAMSRTMGYTEVERHRWGYLTPSGKTAIAPRFARARPFRGQYAVAQKIERVETQTRVVVTTPSGIINRTGNWVVQPKFDVISDPSEGLAKARLPRPMFRPAHDKTVYEGYVDMTGQFVIAIELGQTLQEAGDFSGGLAWVHPMLSMEVAQRYMNDDDIKTLKAFYGTTAVPEQVRTANTPYGYIDKTGKVVIDARFKKVTDFSEGRAAVQDGKTLKWGFIDRTGAWLVKPRFDWASPYSNGLAAVERGKRCGYLNLQSDEAIPPRFKHCFPFKEGYAVVVKTNGRWAFVDPAGQERPVLKDTPLEPIVDVGDFSDGLSAVKLKTQAGTRWGFVDQSGAVKIKPAYTNREPPVFMDGLARVEVVIRGPSTELWNQGQTVDLPHVGYIDNRGRWVFGPVPRQSGF
ncbi:MAG: WG repeat-containing protein [Bradymonadia bacterium]